MVLMISSGARIRFRNGVGMVLLLGLYSGIDRGIDVRGKHQLHVNKELILKVRASTKHSYCVFK